MSAEHRARARRRWWTLGALVVLLVAMIPATATRSAAAAPSRSLTFSIDYLRQIEDPDSGGVGEGDYFPRVKIGDGPLVQGPRIEDDEFEPKGLPEAPNGWVFTNTDLPGDQDTVNITVAMWEYDSGVNSNEDRMDISPRDQDVVLDLVYDFRTGSLTGDDFVFGTPCTHSNGQPKGQSCVQGDGDHGFPRNNDGRITRIGVSIVNDADGDGIPDAVELNGVRDRSGAMIANLPALGADPCRKTIVLQTDFMVDAAPATAHSHQPKAGAITLVRDVFEAAPVRVADPCPYPGTRSDGIDFVHIPGAQLAEQAFMGMANNADFRNARTANLRPELAPYAHYTIFAHDLVTTNGAGSVNSPGTSGQCCEPTRDNNKDFIVTLGSWRTMCVVDFGVDYAGDGMLQSTRSGDDVIPAGTTQIHVGDNGICDSTSGHATDRQVLTVGTGAADARVGTEVDQAGTILHELGHALNLRHGGDNNDQYKPNYLSVMNYFFQTGIPNSPPPLLVNQLRDWQKGAVRLDFSTGALPQLAEGSLLENNGIADGADFTFWWTVLNPATGFRPLRSGIGNAPLNWNDSTNPATGAPIIEATGVPVDINAEKGLTTLSDHNDWPAIKYRAIQSPDVRGPACSGYPAGAPTCTGSGDELTFATVVNQEMSFFNLYDPDVKVGKTVDKADAEPGDTLTYQVKLDNIGAGPAASIEVTDDPPTGADQTRALPYLGVGNSATETFTYEIPCDTADASVLTNKATVTAEDTAGGAEANTGDNSAQASTTIHAPRLTLDKTAPATVNAGEAMTIDIEVANVGSANATGVVLTDTLPAEVYYSKALDRGAGPKPDTVTRNADGTTTLTWTLGTLAAAQDLSVRFTARPSLLFTAGAQLPDTASVTYGNAKGCTYDPVTDSATTGVTEVTPSRAPRSHGYWKTHPEERTWELLARVQATDQRFDSSGDGELSNAEAGAVLSANGPQPAPARFQLAAALLDLAARHINASTRIDSALSRRLGTGTVGAAVRYAFATLALPVSSATAQRYSDATALLDEIVNNRSEVY
ncbi:hypothetical protein ACIBH1_13840 [Nonomuraea sp. NPDC050663]|uniref:DUF7507 domain-containing protein n=1 Tax=Nonomuraea sp. NPDC050663 TaxID=3364370 RepID=UPI0037BB37E0